MISRICLYTLLLFCCACNRNPSDPYSYYRSVDQKDTSYIKLRVDNKAFFGDYVHMKGNIYQIRGKFKGKTQGDTLSGNMVYIPHKHKHEKRVAFALLYQVDSVKLGKGTPSIYLGIPYFQSNSMDFGSEATFYRVECPPIFMNK